MSAAKSLRIVVGERVGDVGALLQIPGDPRALYLLAHGAGAGMEHRFMSAMAERFAERRIGTLRYQFPYTENGKRRPDPPRVLHAAVRAAAAAAAEHAGDLPVVAGGKSMGGRMTSQLAADDGLPNVKALVFLGFPLHSPAKPGSERAAHLSDVEVPMLFVQGDRDNLARLDLLEPVLESLGERAHLHVVEGGDHGFHVLKRSGRTDDEALDECADTVSNWLKDTLSI